VEWFEFMCVCTGINCVGLCYLFPSHELYCWLGESVYSHTAGLGLNLSGLI
jgi:hypothetical protein